jgi:hypothetical protein
LRWTRPQVEAVAEDQRDREVDGGEADRHAAALLDLPLQERTHGDLRLSARRKQRHVLKPCAHVEGTRITYPPTDTAAGTKVKDS